MAVAISFVLVVDLFGSDLTTHSFGLQNIIISTVGLFGPGMAGGVHFFICLSHCKTRNEHKSVRLANVLMQILQM